jgi:hypothetical protein
MRSSGGHCSAGPAFGCLALVLLVLAASADSAAAARPVLDDKGLAELLGNLIEHLASDQIVGGTAAKRAHDQDRARRPLLLGHGRRADRNCGHTRKRRA